MEPLAHAYLRPNGVPTRLPNTIHPFIGGIVVSFLSSSRYTGASLRWPVCGARTRPGGVLPLPPARPLLRHPRTSPIRLPTPALQMSSLSL